MSSSSFSTAWQSQCRSRSRAEESRKKISFSFEASIIALTWIYAEEITQDLIVTLPKNFCVPT